MSSSQNDNPWESLVYSRCTNQYKSAILGHQKRLGTDPTKAILAALRLGAHPAKICILHVPSNQTEPGFQSIVPAEYQHPIPADGVRLTERDSAVILQTADCPTLILTDVNSGSMVVTHAGRAALTPFEADASDTIVEVALTQLGARTLHTVQAFVLGDISGTHFLHDHESARPLIEPFLALGDDVFDDKARLGLSLYTVIRHRLTKAGVPPDNIDHYEDCTYGNTRYASHRRDRNRDDRNHVIVVKKR